MVLPFAAAAIGGAALGGGASILGGQAQRSSERYGRSMDRSLEATMRAAFQNDPLLQHLLGSMSQYRGAPFNPDEMFKLGMEQINRVQERRNFDARRALAAQGFAGENQMQNQIGAQLGQQAGFEAQGLRDFVDQAAIQARQQGLLGDLGSFLGGLGNNLGIGASLGALGTRAGRGPAYESGGMGLPNFNTEMVMGYLPQNQQANFLRT